jgi:hypothetical protein
MKHASLLFTALTLVLPLAGASGQSPYLTAQPASLSLSSGQVAVFKVASTNALSYQWRKNGTALFLTDRVSGVTGPILSISPALAGDAGVYTVGVSNVDGVTPSDPATLSMNLTLPFFTRSPLSQAGTAGTTVSLPAAVSGSEPLSYRWVRYGTPLSDDGRITGATSPRIDRSQRHHRPRRLRPAILCHGGRHDVLPDPL